MSESIPRSTPEQPRAEADSASGRYRLAAAVAVVALIWLGVLPAAGNSASLRSAIEARRERGIDASAMFYTELEVMDDILARNRQFRRDNPDALWSPASL
ncbi:hypothetical protein GC176_23875 [bacterium]|nr:hypothetical protein [bacterium]